jgi:hypothetical protein
MNKPNNDINYSFHDIERYLQGKLSAAEMHALEKAALQDPFLAEAIEGYESADLSAVETDLTAIRNQLQEHEGDTKIIRLTPFRSWWKIAAMIILVAGAGTIAWKIISDQPGKQELASQITPAAKEVLTEQNQTNTSAAVPETETDKNTLAIKHQKPAAPAKTVAAQSVADTSNLIQQQNDLASIQSTIQSKEQVRMKMDTVTFDARSYSNKADTQALQRRFTASVQSAKEKRSAYELLKNLPSVTDVASLGEKTGIRGDSVFFIANDKKLIFKQAELSKSQRPVSSTGSLQAIIFSPTGDVTTGASTATLGGNLSPEGNFTAGLFKPTIKDSFTLNEVVVTGYSPSKKTATSGATTISTTSPVQKDFKVFYPSNEQSQNTSVYPTGGWDMFTRQLRSKISAYKKSSTIVLGDIELKMELDKKGNAVKVTILKTFDATLNELVTEAIKQQEHWGFPSDSKQQKREMTVTIKL